MATSVLNPPGPNLGYFGVQSELQKDRLAFIQHLSDTYGDIAMFKLAGTKIYLVSNPDHIREVLVTRADNFTKSRALKLGKYLLGNGLLTNEGESHRRQRKLIQPVFHRQKIANFGEAMVERARRMRERWSDGQQFDMSREMMSVTLSIVGKTLFDAEIENEADEIGRALTEAFELFDRVSSPIAFLLNVLPLPSNFRFLRARKRLDETVYRLIAEHRKSGDRGDLLSMLLQAQDEDDGTFMTDQQLRDEAITLLLAGHETTANALTWTWYLLSQNPEAEKKMHDEIDSALGGRLPSFDDLPKLPYTRMVLAEGMRLYPPAHTFGRTAIGEFKLGGYTIPAKSVIFMSPYAMHRKPEYWPEPEAFRPERFTPEEEAKRPKFSYFPFGGGPRVCIGDGFAWAEGTLLLATFGQMWNFRLVPGHPVEKEPKLTLRPKFGMKMTAHRR
jgi:cytochrome P450